MTQQITVDIRTIYGREMIYPVGPAAQAFADLAKAKTLTRAQLDIIKALGFKVTVKQKEL
jgi:hypothetical protein